jgi:acyl carrier protein
MTISRVIKIVSQHLGVRERDIRLNHRFIEDLGADSLDTVELVMALEEEFNVEVEDHEVKGIKTVVEATDLINSKLKALEVKNVVNRVGRYWCHTAYFFIAVNDFFDVTHLTITGAEGELNGTTSTEISDSILNEFWSSEPQRHMTTTGPTKVEELPKDFRLEVKADHVDWDDIKNRIESGELVAGDPGMSVPLEPVIQPQAPYTEEELLKGLNPDTAHVDESFDSSPEWTDKHYDHDYEITDEDIERGYIRIDPYFVAMMWRLGQKDDTGILFHNLKNISRFGDKNSIQREIDAFEAQIKRLKELSGAK